MLVTKTQWQCSFLFQREPKYSCTSWICKHVWDGTMRNSSFPKGKAQLIVPSLKYLLERRWISTVKSRCTQVTQTNAEGAATWSPKQKQPNFLIKHVWELGRQLAAGFSSRSAGAHVWVTVSGGIRCQEFARGKQLFTDEDSLARDPARHRHICSCR